MFKIMNRINPMARRILTINITAALTILALLTAFIPTNAAVTWFPSSAVCDSNTLTVTISVLSPTTATPRIFVNGTPIGTLSYSNVSADFTFSLKDTRFSMGATVSVVNPSDPINYIVTATCTAGRPGPPIPVGFVIAKVFCNTAVYDSPGGSAVGSNLIYAGQHWFANPTPVKDMTGKAWVELFVGSYQDVFIPAACLSTSPTATATVRRNYGIQVVVTCASALLYDAPSGQPINGSDVTSGQTLYVSSLYGTTSNYARWLAVLKNGQIIGWIGAVCVA